MLMFACHDHFEARPDWNFMQNGGYLVSLILWSPLEVRGNESFGEATRSDTHFPCSHTCHRWSDEDDTRRYKKILKDTRLIRRGS